MKIYTRRGDDGTTGLFRGGRVSKDDPGPEAYGAVDEAVAALGAARAAAGPEAAERILEIQRELFVVAAELATAPEHRAKLEGGVSRVTSAMVGALEARIDELSERAGLPDGFVVPGGSAEAAHLDVARTIVRRAERRSVAYARTGGLVDSQVVPYLNRLADLLFVMARAAEESWEPSRKESR